MSTILKKGLVRYFLSVIIILTIVSYFAEYKPLNDLVSTIVSYSVIITAFALPIGALNLIRFQVNSIIRRRQDWYMSMWMLFCIFLMTGVGVFFGTTHPVYSWIYDNVSIPAGAAIYATTAFYLAPAMFRSFRVRNIESVLLLFASSVVMLKNAPIGETIWKGVVPLGNWLSDYAQNTGVRVIWIGVGIGFVALCVRYIFGLETLTIGEE